MITIGTTAADRAAGRANTRTIKADRCASAAVMARSTAVVRRMAIAGTATGSTEIVTRAIVNAAKAAGLAVPAGSGRQRGPGWWGFAGGGGLICPNIGPLGGLEGRGAGWL